MGLKPVFDSRDEFFNVEAAQAAYELVMKMDEEEARSFTTMVAVDLLWDTIEKNQRTLQRHLNEVIAKQASVGALVAQRRGDEELAKSLEELSKAGRNPYYYGYVFDENDFNRDRRTGQFKAKIKYTGTKKPVPDRHAKRIGLPTEKASGLKGRRLAEHQQEYQQVATFLDAFDKNGLAGSTDFLLHTEKGTIVHHGTQFPKKSVYDPELDGKILSVEARPTGLTAGGAAFGLVGALGGGPEAQDRAGIYTNRAVASAPAFRDAWLDGAEEPTSSNARLYNRVAAGSDFVGNVAPYGSKVQLAAKFGSLVGHQGPEAEKVIGPGIRTKMYRYRGTEKTPDRELSSQYNRLIGGYAGDAVSPEAHQDFRQRQVKALASARRKKGSELSQAERAQALATVEKPSSGTSQRSDVGRQRAFSYAVEYMDSKVPNKGLYDLNLKAGNTPPSEGIIIDKNGKIVTQAIGYGDDHYLPFNLKNLSGLRGGEYIRTRSVGGPTREDIYTGLVMGAQRVTVVSRSGVFTVEFDDTFRGTRRYNDKAARMVSRYEKLIDAVKSKDVSRMDVEPSVKRKIAQEVEDDLGDWTSPREKRNEYNKRIAEYKAFPTLTEEDEAQIQAAFERTKTGVESKDREVLADLRNQALETKAFNFELNGEGYAAAISALQEQFPYYIKDASHRPRPGRQVGRYESEKDRGYVKPRHNRPEEALDGFYDKSIKGTPREAVKDFEGNDTGKYTADSANYQNWKYNKQNPNNHARGKLTPVAESGGSDSARVSANAQVSEREIVADNLARKEARKSQLDAAWEFKQHARSRVEGDAIGGDWINKDRPEFERWYENPANQKTFEQDMEVLASSKMPTSGRPVVEDRYVTTYHATKGRAGGEEYNFGTHRSTTPDAPFEFKGREFLRGGEPAHKEAALRKLAKETPLPGHPPLDQIEGTKDFRAALDTAKQLREIAYEAKESGTDPRAYARELARRGDVDSGAERYLISTEQANKLVDNVNKAWRIRHNLTDLQQHLKAQGLERTKQLDAEGAKVDAAMASDGEVPVLSETSKELGHRVMQGMSPKYGADKMALQELWNDVLAAEKSGKSGDVTLAHRTLDEYLKEHKL